MHDRTDASGPNPGAQARPAAPVPTRGVGTATGVSLSGSYGSPVTVTARLAPSSTPRLTLIGFTADTRDRVRAALSNAGHPLPDRGTLTVDAAPASLDLSGSGLDLAIAAAILRALSILPAAPDPERHGVSELFAAELGLDGSTRPLRGVLPRILAARKQAGADHADEITAYTSVDNAEEAEQAPGVRVVPTRGIAHLVAVAHGEQRPAPIARTQAPPRRPAPDLAQVLGNHAARRALEIAAAGRHHLALIAFTGAPITQIAEALTGILPRLEPRAALEVAAVRSLSGEPALAGPAGRTPPFVHVHHSQTPSFLYGSGKRPGAVSRAHHGVLYLPDAPQFQRRTLDALREPLESGESVIACAGRMVRYPADFQLVLSASACPCGDESADCLCTPRQRTAYLARIPGPVLDRAALRVDVHPARPDDCGEATAVVADRVHRARQRAARRLAGTPWSVNAQVPAQVLAARWPLSGDATRPIDRLARAGVLTERGAHAVVRVAWTISDLDGRDAPTADAVREALILRVGAALVD